MTIHPSDHRDTIVVSYNSYCGLSLVAPIIDPFVRKMDGVMAKSYRAFLAAGQTARQINRENALPEDKTPSIHSRCICHTDPPVMQESGLPPLREFQYFIPHARSEDGEVLSLTEEHDFNTDGAIMSILSRG
jgi:hypothetical protein